MRILLIACLILSGVATFLALCSLVGALVGRLITWGWWRQR